MSVRNIFCDFLESKTTQRSQSDKRRHNELDKRRCHSNVNPTINFVMSILILIIGFAISSSSAEEWLRNTYKSR